MHPEAINISIAQDFAVYPAGRDASDGPDNGERFLEELLLPRYDEAKSKNVCLVIRLEGVKSFGSSFLEEAFGGLARKKNVDKADLTTRLKIESDRPGLDRYERAIKRYIYRA